MGAGEPGALATGTFFFLPPVADAPGSPCVPGSPRLDFTPISTACFSYLPPEKSNAASSLFNLSRNLGASFGIATVIALVSRYSQSHHSVLVSRVTPRDPAYRAMLAGLTHRFMASGSGAYQAAQQAQAAIAGMINRQSAAMAYLDCFRMTALFCFALIPLAWFLKPVLHKKGERVHVE